jgi:membrane protease YdiL (CAAX protease family)
MNATPARGFLLGTALLVSVLAAGAALAAEFGGASRAIWCGAGGGALIVLLGHLCNLRAIAARSGPLDLGEEARRWRAWGIGLLVRFLLLAALAAVFWLSFGADFQAAMLSLLAAYLALHVWEIVWLCRRASAAEREAGRG